METVIFKEALQSAEYRVLRQGRVAYPSRTHKRGGIPRHSIVTHEITRSVTWPSATSELAQAGAGFVEVGVSFGEAESQQVFAAAGAEEGGAGHGCYAGGGE